MWGRISLTIFGRSSVHRWVILRTRCSGELEEQYPGWIHTNGLCWYMEKRLCKPWRWRKSIGRRVYRWTSRAFADILLASQGYCVGAIVWPWGYRNSYNFFLHFPVLAGRLKWEECAWCLRLISADLGQALSAQYSPISLENLAPHVRCYPLIDIEATCSARLLIMVS